MSKIQKIEGRDNVGRDTGSDDDDNGSGYCDADDNVEFGSKIRGQLGIELLSDIERSCLKQVDNKRMILGLTVEATLVCILLYSFHLCSPFTEFHLHVFLS